MNRHIVLLFLALVLTGCGQKDPGELVLTEPASEVTSSPRSAMRIGRQAYEDTCAGCHEEGLDGAPRTGVLEDWDGRSWLWETVLFEHARSGYKNMPAKGGDEALDELTVTKAAEYMLTLTYPDTPQG